jgi:Flp pilus assembly protein TadD
MKRLVATAALCLAASFAASAAFAAGGEPTGIPTDPLAKPREMIAAKQWQAAVTELRQINATDSADWHNLMGYSLRKAKTPDLEGAQKHYDEALRINPKHRGALEYSGELFLMKGDLAGAEKRLAQLDRACLFSCEEYKDLKKAIEQYKANGNKAIAAQ